MQDISATDINKWLDSVSANAHTRKSYAAHLKLFFKYLDNQSKSFDNLELNDFNIYKNELIESGATSSTISSRIMAIKSFYRWKFPVDNPARDFKSVRVSKTLKREILTIEEVYELLASIKRDTEAGARDYAILNLMIRTGLRDVEVSNATIGALDYKDGYAVLHILGKGHIDEDEYAYLDLAALNPIDEYLDQYRVREASSPLFCSTSNNSKGEALNSAAIGRIVKKRLRDIGIDDARYTAHSLRHSAITYALKGGASIEQVQRMARHKNIGTTNLYVHDYDRRTNPAELAVGRVLDEM